MLGGTQEHIVNAVCNAFMDCSPVLYRLMLTCSMSCTRRGLYRYDATGADRYRVGRGGRARGFAFQNAPGSRERAQSRSRRGHRRVCQCTRQPPSHRCRSGGQERGCEPQAAEDGRVQRFGRSHYGAPRRARRCRDDFRVTSPEARERREAQDPRGVGGATARRGPCKRSDMEGAQHCVGVFELAQPGRPESHDRRPDQLLGSGDREARRAAGVEGRTWRKI